MSYKSTWASGSWNVICDSCGRQFKAGDLKLRWDGLMVCQGDWEPRQPQDFVRGVADIQAPVWTRPQSSDTFIPINWTQQPSETVSLDDSVQKNVTKNIGGSVWGTQGLVNGSAVDTIALNNTQAVAIDLEKVSVSESISIAANKTVSETATVTESVSILLSSLSSLNGAALNSFRLD
jgi:hypothetical protein